jgi:putative two-component system response regulator
MVRDVGLTTPDADGRPGVFDPAPRAKHVLVIDDQDEARRTLDRVLTSFGYRTELAASGEEALEKLVGGVDLVILDARMPGMSGFELTQRIRRDPAYFDLPVVMVTGLDSKEDRLHAVEAGVNDFIAKPFDVSELRLRSAWLLRMKEATDALKRHRCELERAVEDRTTELRQALREAAAAQQRTAEAHLDTIRRLVLAAEHKDRATAGHIERIGRYCELISHGLGLRPERVRVIRYASIMHDVGKIGIPDAILLKSEHLTPAEWQVMKQHTVIGARILHGSPSELLQLGEVIALSHHEKWDGSGYPHGLAGRAIPLAGRICAVADVFDALTHERHYRQALSNETVYAMLAAQRGLHFDPQVLDVFFDHRRAAETIQQDCRTDGE